MSNEMPIVNIQSQQFEHQEARIIGTKAGLETLKKLIDEAIGNYNSAMVMDRLTGKEGTVFASDGEGYEIQVICHTGDDWGEPIKEGKPNFWNQKENTPTYVMQEQAAAVSQWLQEEANKKPAGTSDPDGTRD
jgi:hypothetical protein